MAESRTRFANAWARAEHRALHGCDRAACELDATTKRHDDFRGYDHPFCAKHAAEWDGWTREQRVLGDQNS